MQLSNKVLPREETMVGFARSNTWRVFKLLGLDKERLAIASTFWTSHTFVRLWQDVVAFPVSHRGWL